MLSDLVFVLRYIKQVLEEFNLPDLYTNFTNTLQQISQESTPELQQALKDYKQRIKEAHQALEPEGWSYSQLKVFDAFGAKDIIGESGLVNFQNALTENSANPVGAIEELNKQREGINQLLKSATDIITSLGDLAQEVKIKEGSAIIQIVFDEKVAIENLINLYDQSKEWKNIIRAYSLFAGESPEKTEIIATSKDNPYNLWLITPYFIARIINATVKQFIDLYKQILEAKEHALALEKMKVEVDTKRFELFKTIEEFESKKIKQIMQEVIKKHEPKSLDRSQKNEARNALLMAGPKLYDFITSGGKVDTSKEDGNRRAFSNFQLGTKYNEIHKLEGKVQKLLTAKGEQEEKERKPRETEKLEKKRGRPKKG